MNQIEINEVINAKEYEDEFVVQFRTTYDYYNRTGFSSIKYTLPKPVILPPELMGLDWGKVEEFLNKEQVEEEVDEDIIILEEENFDGETLEGDE